MTEINPVNNSSSGNYKKQDTKAGLQNSNLKESLFTKCDTNKDGKVSVEELMAAGYSEKEACILANSGIFSAERNVNKWFKIDRDFNGVESNFEKARWDEWNENSQCSDGELTIEEYARKYAMTTDNDTVGNIEAWIDDWINNENPMKGIKIRVEKELGRKLTDDENQMLYDAAKIQMNNWLFKPELSLYERAGLDAYTKLITQDELESCCGGDITKPPEQENGVCVVPSERSTLFRPMREVTSENTAAEIKNRLAWAAFKTMPQENMSDAEYKEYQNRWFKMKEMKASEYRDMLKPENSKQKEEFEKNSGMTVSQIVEFIDIIESTTGKDFDSNDWKITGKQWFSEVTPKINGTYNEAGLLKGKTRADVPPERQKLLEYLEKNGLLLDQFKQ